VPGIVRRTKASRDCVGVVVDSELDVGHVKEPDLNAVDYHAADVAPLDYGGEPKKQRAVGGKRCHGLSHSIDEICNAKDAKLQGRYDLHGISTAPEVY
jgi:hypothetical protein